MPQYPPSLTTWGRHRQRGVSLLVVLVFVMLSMLLTVWASRTSLFTEMVVGNDADWQRAFEAAQTLLQDAELDIRGERADGNACQAVTGKPKACRAAGSLQFPITTEGPDGLLALLNQLAAEPETARCKDGLCLKRARTQQQDFWNEVDGYKPHRTMQQQGVRYGTYTGATAGSNDAPGNPILYETGDDRGGRYWIEILPYDNAAPNMGLIADSGTRSDWIMQINSTPKVIYRITAIATGRKPHTRVVLQQVYARNKLKD